MFSVSKLLKSLAVLAFLTLTSCSHFLTSKEPGAASLYRRLALNYVGQKHFPEAFSSLEKSKALSPNSTELHNIYGLAYLGINKPQLAHLSFKKAVELSPENTEARNNYIAILIKQGRLKEALPLAKKSLDDLTYTFRQQSASLVGQILFKMNKNQEALIYLNIAYKRSPQNCGYNLYLAKALQKGSQRLFKNANKSWKQVAKLCKHSQTARLEAYYYLGANNKITSNLEVSKFFLNKALETEQKNSLFYTKSLSLLKGL